MKNSSFISIRNGIIATVVGGIILLFIPAIRALFIRFFQWIWTGLKWAGNTFVSSYSIPGWLILGVSIFAVIGIINVFLAFKGESEKPEFLTYTEDYLYNTRWRWQWIGNQISNLWCFCSGCDATLVYDDSSCRRIYPTEIKTDFICENCGHIVVSSVPGGNKDYAIGAVKREIDRRVRTGEYRRNTN